MAIGILKLQDVFKHFQPFLRLSTEHKILIHERLSFIKVTAPLVCIAQDVSVLQGECERVLGLAVGG